MISLIAQIEKKLIKTMFVSEHGRSRYCFRILILVIDIWSDMSQQIDFLVPFLFVSLEIYGYWQVYYCSISTAGSKSSFS